jgi:hypothetical protein
LLRLVQTTTLALAAVVGTVSAQTKDTKPNILVIFGDDIGITDISAYGQGIVGYRTPNAEDFVARYSRRGLWLK